MKLHNFSSAKLFVLFIVILSFISITRFFAGPNCMAGQTIISKTLFNIKDILQKEQGSTDIDYGKEALNYCNYHIVQEEIIIRRLLEWQNLIFNNTDRADLDKLEKVNRFFNQMEYFSDMDHWGEEDYWATPVEFIVCQTGDCEDFSIAKYFTLYAMGVPEEKLSLTYVKTLNYDSHHIVLLYYSKPDADPLILDNTVDNVKHGFERSDLIPIYSFNGTSLWLAEQRGRGKFAGNSNRLKLWQDLMERMPVENM